MMLQLYPIFQHWSSNGSVYIISDPHFDDEDCKLMCKNWITPIEQIERINNKVMPSDTLVILGDIGNEIYLNMIKSRYRILVKGNHDKSNRYYTEYFNEIYEGALFIGEKILLSHEPIGVPFAVNIHGHDHCNKEIYKDECKYLNLAANVCNYTPVNLGKLIKQGLLSDIQNIHRLTINEATERKQRRTNNE